MTSLSSNKEISTKTVQALEPLFKYFQMVCESTEVSYPGFRLGPGGSVIRRAPFLSKRLALRNKQMKKEMNQILSSPVIADTISTTTASIVSRVTTISNNNMNTQSKKSMVMSLYRRFIPSAFMALMITFCCGPMNCVLAKQLPIGEGNKKSQAHGPRRHVNHYLHLKSSPFDEDEDDVPFKRGFQSKQNQVGKGKKNSKQALSKPSVAPLASPRTLTPTIQPTTTDRFITVKECHNVNRLIFDSAYDNSVPTRDSITLDSDLVIHSVEVYVNITHEWRNDLIVTLVHTNGVTKKKTSAILFLNAPDEPRIRELIGTYPTTLQPTDSLDVFHGDISGNKWTLEVLDTYSGYRGTLNEWLLLFIKYSPTDDYVQFAAYKWVTDHAAALAHYGHISTWDISRVTNMDHVFSSFNPYATEDDWAISFNDDISKWDTSKVTSMNSMFVNAFSFNGDLSGWDISQVTDLSWTFEAFNGDLSRWDVSHVTSLRRMFLEARSFVGGDLSGWNTAKVETMRGTFQYANSFNGDVSTWNTSKVTTLRFTFCGTLFNGDVSKWNTSRVMSLTGSFDTSAFNGDLSKWDTSKVTEMDATFFGGNDLGGLSLGSSDVIRAFNGDISQWDTSSVVTMESMFYSNERFNGNLSKWNTQNVSSMFMMFNKASSFNGDLSAWKTNNVVNMHCMFCKASSFNGNLAFWNTSSVEYMSFMFYNATSFNTDLSKWDTSNVVDTSLMFYNAFRFNSDLSKWNTSQVTNMGEMFFYASSFNQTLCWDISKVSNETDYYGYPGLSVFYETPGKFAAKPYPACLPKPTVKPNVKKTKKV